MYQLLLLLLRVNTALAGSNPASHGLTAKPQLSKLAIPSQQYQNRFGIVSSYKSEIGIIDKGVKALFSDERLTLNEDIEILDYLFKRETSASPSKPIESSELNKFAGVKSFFKQLEDLEYQSHLISKDDELKTAIELLNYTLAMVKKNGIFSSSDKFPFAECCVMALKEIEEIKSQLEVLKPGFSSSGLETNKKKIEEKFVAASDFLKTQTVVLKDLQESKKVTSLDLFSSFLNYDFSLKVKALYNNLRSHDFYYVASELDNHMASRGDDARFKPVVLKIQNLFNYLEISADLLDFIFALSNFETSAYRLAKLFGHKPNNALELASKAYKLSVSLMRIMLSSRPEAIKDIEARLKRANIGWWNDTKLEECFPITLILEISKDTLESVLDGKIKDEEANLATLEKKEPLKLDLDELNKLNAKLAEINVIVDKSSISNLVAIKERILKLDQRVDALKETRAKAIKEEEERVAEEKRKAFAKAEVGANPGTAESVPVPPGETTVTPASSVIAPTPEDPKGWSFNEIGLALILFAIVGTFGLLLYRLLYCKPEEEDQIEEENQNEQVPEE